MGHPEILRSHRWVENNTSNCHVCGKHTYAIFIWNKRMAMTGANAKFYGKSMLEPVALA